MAAALIGAPRALPDGFRTRGGSGTLLPGGGYCDWHHVEGLGEIEIRTPRLRTRPPLKTTYYTVAQPANNTNLSQLGRRWMSKNGNDNVDAGRRGGPPRMPRHLEARTLPGTKVSQPRLSRGRRSHGCFGPLWFVVGPVRRTRRSLVARGDILLSGSRDHSRRAPRQAGLGVSRVSRSPFEHETGEGENVGRQTDDLAFFRDRVAFAIERDQLERSTNNPPFDRFEERTVETHKAGDVMDAMLPIDSPEEAKAFVAGYAQDFVEQHGFSPAKADKVAQENLTYAVMQVLSDPWNKDKAALWHSVLR